MGSFILQLASSLGLSPIVGTASSQRGRDMIEKDLGCLALDHSDPEHLGSPLQKKLDEKNLRLPKRPITNVNAFDIVIEMQAQHNLQTDIDHLNYKGIVVIVGNKGHVEVPVNGRAIMQCEGRVTGFMGLGEDMGSGFKHVYYVGNGTRGGGQQGGL